MTLATIPPRNTYTVYVGKGEPTITVPFCVLTKEEKLEAYRALVPGRWARKERT